MDGAPVIIFQFLMVRLKVVNSQVHLNVRMISIPYGAIKSQTNYESGYMNYVFQFLMVRLKD